MQNTLNSNGNSRIQQMKMGEALNASNTEQIRDMIHEETNENNGEPQNLNRMLVASSNNSKNEGTPQESGFEEDSEEDDIHIQGNSNCKYEVLQSQPLHSLSSCIEQLLENVTPQQLQFCDPETEEGSTSAGIHNAMEKNRFIDKRYGVNSQKGSDEIILLADDDEATAKNNQRKMRQQEMVPGAIPIITQQYSLKPDMLFGWKPEIQIHGAPIPLYFDYETLEHCLPLLPKQGIQNAATSYFESSRSNNEEDLIPVAYHGPRFKDSLEMHKAFANRVLTDKDCKKKGVPTMVSGQTSYKFKFPPNMNVIDAMQISKPKHVDYRPFIGMNPSLAENNGFLVYPPKSTHNDEDSDFFGNASPSSNSHQQIEVKPQPIFKKASLIFDSDFECGNLDLAVQIRDMEYDLYMRVDSNTRGHHQWFYFTVSNSYNVKGRVKFNIVNFTKDASLYHQGMRINVFSQRDFDIRLAKAQNSQQSTQAKQGMEQIEGNGTQELQNAHGMVLPNEGWVKGCENITYKPSKISRPRFVAGQGYVQPNPSKRYYQVSFEYDFNYDNDNVSFAYSVPYTFSKLTRLMRTVMSTHLSQFPCQSNQFVKESNLCKSLSGLDVPMLTISSRVHSKTFEAIDEHEFASAEALPLNKFKKYIIVCARVHPGETNASFIMQGFINFITSPTNPEAIELRKRIVFKVIPCTNPDGVIVGNYRASMSGNDLNRQFVTPNVRLHLTVCAIKALVADITNNAREPEPISAFIDIHGHSRKKSIFIYGPHFPLHNERYLKMRVLPKLLSERTEMFRFYSCKFRIQKSKLKAARVVLWKEFNIMNCFTLESSFHGFIDKDRQTIELTTEMLESMGHILGSGFHEYQTLIEEDEKQKLLLKQHIKNKKKKMKAKDIAQAYTNKQEQQIMNVGKQQQQIQSDHLLVNFEGKSEQQPSEGVDVKAESQDPQLQSNNFQESGNQQTEGIIKTQQKCAIGQSGESTKKNGSNIRLKQPQASKGGHGSLKRDLKSIVVKPQIETSITQQNMQQLQKRTLKEIYKILKRDAKSLAIAQQDTSQANDNKEEYDSLSESSDSDGNDSCDGADLEDGEGQQYDELTPSELEELQNDILRALENFDQIYNNNSAATNKKKKNTTTRHLTNNNGSLTNKSQGMKTSQQTLVSAEKSVFKKQPESFVVTNSFAQMASNVVSQQTNSVANPTKLSFNQEVALIKKIGSNPEAVSLGFHKRNSFLIENNSRQLQFQKQNSQQQASTIVSQQSVNSFIVQGYTPASGSKQLMTGNRTSSNNIINNEAQWQQRRQSTRELASFQRIGFDEGIPPIQGFAVKSSQFQQNNPHHHLSNQNLSSTVYNGGGSKPKQQTLQSQNSMYQIGNQSMTNMLYQPPLIQTQKNGSMVQSHSLLISGMNYNNQHTNQKQGASCHQPSHSSYGQPFVNPAASGSFLIQGDSSQKVLQPYSHNPANGVGVKISSIIGGRGEVLPMAKVTLNQDNSIMPQVTKASGMKITQTGRQGHFTSTNRRNLLKGKSNFIQGNPLIEQKDNLNNKVGIVSGSGQINALSHEKTSSNAQGFNRNRIQTDSTRLQYQQKQNGDDPQLLSFDDEPQQIPLDYQYQLQYDKFSGSTSSLRTVVPLPLSQTFYQHNPNGQESSAYHYQMNQDQKQGRRMSRRILNIQDDKKLKSNSQGVIGQKCGAIQSVPEKATMQDSSLAYSPDKVIVTKDDHYINGLLANSLNFGYKMVTDDASLKQSLHFPHNISNSKEFSNYYAHQNKIYQGDSQSKMVQSLIFGSNIGQSYLNCPSGIEEKKNIIDNKKQDSHTPISSKNDQKFIASISQQNNQQTDIDIKQALAQKMELQNQILKHTAAGNSYPKYSQNPYQEQAMAQKITQSRQRAFSSLGPNSKSEVDKTQTRQLQQIEHAQTLTFGDRDGAQQSNAKQCLTAVKATAYKEKEKINNVQPMSPSSQQEKIATKGHKVLVQSQNSYPKKLASINQSQGPEAQSAILKSSGCKRKSSQLIPQTCNVKNDPLVLLNYLRNNIKEAIIKGGVAQSNQ